MTRITALAAVTASALAISLSGCVSLDQPLLNSANLTGETTAEVRTVTGFTGVELRGSGSVTIEVGEDFSVTVATDSGLQQHVTTTVADDVLVLQQKFSWIGTQPAIDYTVTLPALSSLSLAGSGDITASTVAADHLVVDSAGAGTITVAGRVATLVVNIAGSGDFLGEELVARDASINIAGSGNVAAGVRRSLAVSIVGSGNVVYYGSPEIEFSTLGSGTVSAG